jgi:hypothetical protein
MKQILFPLVWLAMLAGVVGCKTDTGAYLPRNTNQSNQEATANFVLLDPGAAHSVTHAGITEHVLPDGRLEVIANVRNRENRRIEVQINCVFKDANWVPTGDETPFQNLILTENAISPVRFVSMNNQARKYTIRVRQSR